MRLCHLQSLEAPIKSRIGCVEYVTYVCLILSGAPAQPKNK